MVSLAPRGTGIGLGHRCATDSNAPPAAGMSLRPARHIPVGDLDWSPPPTWKDAQVLHFRTFASCPRLVAGGAGSTNVLKTQIDHHAMVRPSGARRCRALCSGGRAPGATRPRWPESARCGPGAWRSASESRWSCRCSAAERGSWSPRDGRAVSSIRTAPRRLPR